MNVLYVESDRAESARVCDQLSMEAPYLQVVPVYRLKDALRRLERDHEVFDVVVVASALEDASGVSLVTRARDQDWPVVVVVLSDAADEGTVISLLKAGADDCIVKREDYVSRFPATFEGALARFHGARARRERPLRVLYVEDSEPDIELTRLHMARHAPHIHIDAVTDARKALRLLADREGSHDVLLLDYRLPDMTGIEVLREIVQVQGEEIPVVLVTGQGDQEIVLQSVRLGAFDYVIKRDGYLMRLPVVLENAFYRAELAREREALRESQAQYERIVDLAPDGIVTMSMLGVITFCNRAFLDLTGFRKEDFVGKHFTEIPTLRLQDMDDYAQILRTIARHGVSAPIEFRWMHRDGTLRWGEAHVSTIREGSRLQGFQAILAEITERKHSEQLLDAFNRAALAMTQVSSVEDVFAAGAEVLEEIGLTSAVMLADAEGLRVRPAYVGLNGRMVRAIDDLLGSPLSDLLLEIDAIGVFQGAIREERTTFYRDVESQVAEMPSGRLKRLAARALKLLDISRLIVAPLVVEDRPMGCLIVYAADVTEADVSLITAFAHQVAAAWHRAQLYERAQQEILERQRTAELLVESQRQFENVFENAPIGIYRTTPGGQVVLVNPALIQMLGYEDVADLAQLDLEHDPVAPFSPRATFKERISREGHISGLESLWRRKDGTELWVRENATVVHDHRGEIVYYDGTVEDISEGRRSDQLLRSLNQAALAIGSALDRQAVFDVVAAEILELGYSCMLLPLGQDGTTLTTRYISSRIGLLNEIERLVEGRLQEYAFPVDRSDMLREVVTDWRAAFVSDSEALVWQMLPKRLKGLSRRIHDLVPPWKVVLAPLIVQDRAVGVLAVMGGDLRERDLPTITVFAHQVAAAWRKAELYEQVEQELAERVRAEERLRESEERFRALVQNSSDIIVVLDRDGIIEYVSPSVERVLGIPVSHFEGMDPFQFLHPEDRDATHSRLLEAIRQPGVPLLHEFRISDKNGVWVSLETVTTCLFDVPSVRGVVINARDVSERKRLEGQFRQAQKMEAVGQLAGGIAHDFNNLLTGMQGYTALVLDRLNSDMSLDERARQSLLSDLDEVDRASQRAAALTRQLLAFGRKQVLQPVVLDLNDLVSGIQNMLQRLIGENIELRACLAPGLGRVMADPVQIEQVIMNLAINARDAMPQGGKLTIETADVELDKNYVRGHPGGSSGPHVMLAVSDTGVGMDEQVQAHLFEPFFTTKDVGKGTGLGLATVYGIVKQSGGTVWVYSEVGHGTTFKVYLPRLDHATSPAVQPSLESRMPHGEETVLLVEDEDIVRRLAKRILERQGYRVLDMASPREAIEASRLDAEAFDLIVTDVVMPGMSGQDLVNELSSIRPGIRVLFISGYTDEAIAEHGVLDPGVHFVQKPFTPEQLASAVRKALDE